MRPHRLRSPRRWAVALAALFLLAAAGGLLWFRVAPPPLSPLIPGVEKALADLTGAGRVRIGDLRPFWPGGSLRPRLLLLETTIRDGPGDWTVEIPGAILEMTWRDLAARRWVPVRITLREPALRLPARSSRTAEERGLFGWTDRSGAVGEALRGLAGLRPLSNVRLGNGRILVHGTSAPVLRIPRFNLDVIPGNRKTTLAGSLQGEMDGRAVEMTFQAASPTGRGPVTGTVGITDLRPADLALDRPRFAPLRAVAIPLDVAIDFTAGASVTLDRLSLSGGSGTIGSPLFEGPAAVAALRITGEGAPDNVLRIDSASVRFRGGPTLSASGALSLDRFPPAIDLTLRGEGLTLVNAYRYWPPAWAPPVRAWMRDHFQGGGIREAWVRLKIGPEDWKSDVLPASAVTAAVAFADLRLDYFPPLPALHHADGRADFTARGIDIRVEDGRVMASSTARGRVRISGWAEGAPNIDIRSAIQGPAAEMLAALGPLEADPRIKVQIREGSAGGNLRIRFPLGRDFSPEALRVSGRFRMEDLIVPDFPGRPLTDGNLSVRVDDREITAEGGFRSGKTPLTVSWRRRGLGGGTGRANAGSALRLSASLGPADLAAWGIPAAGILTGRAETEATVVPKPDATRIDLQADLGGAALTVPGLRWRKPSGVAGRFLAEIRAEPGGTLRIPKFHLYGSEYYILGYGTVAGGDGGDLDLTVERARLGKSDIGARLMRNRGRRMHLSVSGARLDAGPFLEAEKRRNSHESLSFEGGLSAALDRVDLLNGIRLSDVAARAEYDSGKLRSADLAGIIGGNRPVDVSLTTDADGRRLRIETGDAGALLQGLGLYGHLEGGRLALRLRQAGEYAGGDGFRGGEGRGRLTIEGFKLREAPVILDILSLASLGGIVDQLERRGIGFDALAADLRFDGARTLFVENGRMEGPALGITADGSIDPAGEILHLEGLVVPFNVINRLIGVVPVIGKLITGDGIIAANYTLTGPLAAPEVTVNPLSTLMIGPLRKLFRNLE